MIVSGYRFDIDKANQKLEQMGAQKVMLQLPDGLRRKSNVFIENLNIDVELWGGSCYGACDLPGSIGDADALIHVGHSKICGFKPEYPVIYLEGKSTVDFEVPESFVEKFIGKRVALYSTVQYIDQRDKLAEVLSEKKVDTVIGEGDRRITYPGQVLGCNYSAGVDADEHIYVGTGNFHPIGLALSIGKTVHILNPVTEFWGTTDSMVDKLLRRRFASIVISEEHDSFAILISKKIGQDRRELAEHLKSKYKNCIIIHMDEITPERVDSLGFESMVNTACPRLTLDDSIRFKTVMLTPQEFLITKKELSWENWEMDEIK